MDPLSAGIAGMASLAGGYISNEETMKRQVQNQQWMEKMRATAYQATMEDMQKAGLNPILAYQKGPTSSPTSQFATASDFITPAVNSALQAGKVREEVENLKTTNPLILEQIKTQRSIQEANQATARRQLADADVADVEVQNRKNQTLVSATEAAKSQIDKELYDKLPWMRAIGTGAGELGKVVGAVAPAVNTGANVSRALTFRERWNP